MSTATNKAKKKKSDVPKEEDVFTLDVLLDLFDNGDLDLTVKARQCYLTEQHKALDHRTWLHTSDLKNQSVLRKIGKQNAKDLIR
jgi:hypothetical protein